MHCLSGRVFERRMSRSSVLSSREGCVDQVRLTGIPRVESAAISHSARARWAVEAHSRLLSDVRPDLGPFSGLPR